MPWPVTVNVQGRLNEVHEMVRDKTFVRNLLLILATCTALYVGGKVVLMAARAYFGA